MTYFRVIPRDFFNESKLLKCLGRFELFVIDKRCNGLEIETRTHGERFKIEQDPNDGSLSCMNYFVSLDGFEMELFIPYNSKEEYPLLARYRGGIYYIFDENGNWMPNFGILERLSAKEVL